MTASPDPLLRIDNLSKSFGDHQVLKGISLEVRHGEVVSVIGASGSGKSTFLRCINVLERPDQGDVMVDGQLDCRGRRSVAAGRDAERQLEGAARRHRHGVPEASICGRT